MGKWIFGLTVMVMGMIAGSILTVGAITVKAQAEQSEILVNMDQIINNQEASGDSLSYINGEIPRDNSEVRQSFDKVMDSYLVMWNELPNLYQLVEDLENQKTQSDPAEGLSFSGLVLTHDYAEGQSQTVEAGLLDGWDLYIRSSSLGVGRAVATCMAGMQHWATEEAEGCVDTIDGYQELVIDTATSSGELTDGSSGANMHTTWHVKVNDGAGWTTMAILDAPVGGFDPDGFILSSTNMIHGKVLR